MIDRRLLAVAGGALGALALAGCPIWLNFNDVGGHGSATTSTTTTSGTTGGGGGCDTGPAIAWTKEAALGNASGIATDPTGHVLITGTRTGAIDFGLGPLSAPPPNGADGFLVKLAPSGVPVWDQSFGGANDFGIAVAVDGTGDVVVEGDFQGTLKFGDDMLTSAGTGGMFVAKYSAGGVPAWAMSFGMTDETHAVGIGADSNGDVMAAGTFTGSVQVGNVVLDQGGTFIARLDADGTAVWATALSPAVSARSIAVDAAGNSFVTGFFSGTAAFGCNTITSVGASDLFVAKLDGMGECVWVEDFTGSFIKLEGLAIATWTQPATSSSPGLVRAWSDSITTSSCQPPGMEQCSSRSWERRTARPSGNRSTTAILPRTPRASRATAQGDLLVTRGASRESVDFLGCLPLVGTGLEPRRAPSW